MRYRSASSLVAAALLATLALPVAAPAQPTPSAAPSAAPSASPATAPPAPVPTEEPGITARAKDWFSRIQSGNLDRTQLTAQANAAFTDAVVKNVAGQIAPLGTPTAFTFVDKRAIGDNTAYTYKLSFGSTALYYIFVLDIAGRVSGLRLVPAT